MVNGISINRPSYLTIENRAAMANEKIIDFFPSLKNKTRLVIPNNKNNGSVNPNNEFSTNLGAKTNAEQQRIANELFINFFDKKYTGIIVKVEIITLVKR